MSDCFEKLLEKSQENENAAIKCKENEYFNAGASRAYYSVFQLAKAFLIKKNFDYRKFIESHPEKYHSDEKDYSHGSIADALIQCIKENYQEDKKQTECIVKIKTMMKPLYLSRMKADYKENECMSKMDIGICLNQLKQIKESIQQLETSN